MVSEPAKFSDRCKLITKASPPNVFIGGPVPGFPGFPPKDGSVQSLVADPIKAIVIAALFAISFSAAQFMFGRVYAAQAPLSAKQQALIDGAKKEGVIDI